MDDLQLYVLAPQKETLLSSLIHFSVALFDWFLWFAATFGTLLSVFVAIVLYLWKVRQDKRNAARILLMEIRNAESTLDVIKESGAVAETTFVMPVSSWSKFQHYFVKDFDKDELDDLNHFYNLCILIQKEVNRMKDQLPLSNEEKIKLTQHKLLELAEKYADDNTKYLDRRRAVLYETFFKEEEWFEPKLPKLRILQHLGNVKPILTTTTGQKLKKIADFK